MHPERQCAFTVPMIVNNLNRSSVRRLCSYHCHAETTAEDFIPRTEFGSGTWKMTIYGSFSESSIFAIEHPAAI